MQKKSLLSKYDEEIDGEKREKFVIGVDNLAEQKRAAVQSIKAKLNNKILETITSDTQRQIASDYYNEDELAKFKKPKKKDKKLRQKGKVFTADDLENVVNDKKSKKGFKPDDMIIDDTPGIYLNRSYCSAHINENISDIPVLSDIKLDEKDDVLERALHKARKLKQREQIANDLMSSLIANIKPEKVEENVDVGNNIVLNSTAEFCRTLGKIILIQIYNKSI